MERGRMGDPVSAGSGETVRRWPRPSGRGRAAGHPIARIVLLLLALAVVSLTGAGAVNASMQGARGGDPSRIGSDRLFKTQMETVRRQLSVQVPPRSTVFLGGSAGDLWYQRILEFAVMYDIIVVSDESSADFSLSLVREAAAASPGGLRLVATRNR